MSILGDPDYEAVRKLTKTGLKELKPIEFILNYIVMEVDFRFPMSVQYPSIPTRVDNDVEIYPLKGRSIITGSEYLAAKNMGCTMDVKECILIPFRKKEDVSKQDTEYTNYITPFRGLVKELQKQRRICCLCCKKKTFYFT